MAGERIVTLATIGGGAAMERFAEELDHVLENIADPNTDPEKVRKITLEITFHPNEKRDAGEVSISSSRKVAPVKPADATVFFGKVNGRRVAAEINPNQGSLFDDETQKGPRPIRDVPAEEAQA